MNLKKFVHDDDAVSPVIGVILMVAITVILAAVIASFVLGLGDTAGDPTPQASWSYSFDGSSNPSGGLVNSTSSSGALTISHDGGDDVDMTQVTIRDDDGGVVDASTGSNMDTAFPDTASAGDSGTINVDDDDEIRLIWSNPDGDSSTVLSEYSV